MKKIFAVVLILLLWGCEGESVIEVSDNNFAVTNKTGSTIHYAVFDYHIIPVISWVMCTDPDCNEKIEAGKGHIFDLNNILVEDGGDTLALYYWTLKQEGTAYTVDKQSSEIIAVDKIRGKELIIFDFEN